MKIRITLKQKETVEIRSLCFENFRGDEIIKVTSECIDAREGITILNDIFSNGKLLDKKLLEWKILKSILGVSVEEEKIWVEIEKMEILEDNYYYKFPEECFSDFIKYRIEGIETSFSKKEYAALWKYFMKKRIHDNAINALQNMDILPKNAIRYLSGEMLDDFSFQFDEEISCTGEDEQNAINHYIEQYCGGIVYPAFISNKGTKEEQVDIIPILKVHLEKIKEIMREYENSDHRPEEYGLTWPELFDFYSQKISLEFVDEIVEDYNIYKIKENANFHDFLLTNASSDIIESHIGKLGDNITIYDLMLSLTEKGFLASLEEEYFYDNYDYILAGEYNLFHIVPAFCEIVYKNAAYYVMVAKEDKEKAEKLMEQAYDCWVSQDIAECPDKMGYTEDTLSCVPYGDFIEEWLKYHKIKFNDTVGYIPLSTYCHEEPAEDEEYEDINEWKDERFTTYFFEKKELQKYFKYTVQLKEFLRNHTYDDVECDILGNVPFVFRYTSN